MLCTIELIVDHKLTSLFEWFADLTLSFGLLPNARISVIGVGWFIGIIFVFYMIFPFFTFLIGNKTRAWIVLFISFVLNVLCHVYFLDETHVLSGFSGRTNIVNCAMFFVAGGLIFLYRDKIICFNIWIIVLITLACVFFYYLVNGSEYTMLFLFSFLVMLGIQTRGKLLKALLQNKAICFVASLSM